MSLTASEDDDEQPQFDLPADESVGPEQQLTRSEMRRSVARGLDSLPDDARKILILRELDGLSYAEIGKVLHLEAGTGEIAPVPRAAAALRFPARRREPSRPICVKADEGRCRRMSACEHYQQQISQLLDGELPPEQVQTLRAHLRTCPECQRVYDDFLSLQAAVRDAAAAPPADLTARIMQQVRQEPVPMPPRSAVPARPARHVQPTPIRRAAQPRRPRESARPPAVRLPCCRSRSWRRVSR